MGKKWPIGCPERTAVTLCLIPNVKFMIYKEEKNYGSFTYEPNMTMSTNRFPDVHK
jgi:hypothetical protein